MFTRSLGSAVGIAVFGGIANTTLADRFRHPPASIAGRLPHSVDTAALAFAHGTGQSPRVAAYTRDSLDAAAHHVFLALVAVAALGMLMQALLPRRVAPLAFPEDLPPAA